MSPEGPGVCINIAEAQGRHGDYGKVKGAQRDKPPLYILAVPVSEEVADDAGRIIVVQEIVVDMPQT